MIMVLIAVVVVVAVAGDMKACLFCHTKKVGCHGGNPCHECVKRDIPCVPRTRCQAVQRKPKQPGPALWACNECSIKKTKCDGGKPCSRCVEKGICCIGRVKVGVVDVGVVVDVLAGHYGITEPSVDDIMAEWAEEGLFHE